MIIINIYIYIYTVQLKYFVIYQLLHPINTNTQQIHAKNILNHLIICIIMEIIQPQILYVNNIQNYKRYKVFKILDQEEKEDHQNQQMMK